MDSNSTQLAAIVADTNELQSELADGGRTDLILDAILTDTGTTLDGKLDTIDGILDNIPDTDLPAVKSDTAAILTDTGTTLDGKIETIDGIVDGLKTTLDNIHDTDLPAVKSDTAAILEDTGTTLDGKIDQLLEITQAE
jgi:hypothetical protein